MKKLFLFIGLFVLLALPAMALANGTVNQIRPITIDGIAGIPLIGISYPQWTDAIVLVANTAQTYTIPTGAKKILFSASMGVDFYVNYTTTATVPGASTATGLAGELNPTLRDITGLTSISIISATAGKLTVALYK